MIKTTLFAAAALGLGAVLAPAQAATETTTITVSDEFAALGFTLSAVGDAAVDMQDGVMTVTLPGAAPAGGSAVAPAPSGFMLTDANGVSAIITDMIFDVDTGMASGMLVIEDWLPNGDVMYGRFDMFELNAVDAIMSDLVVSGEAGATLALYLGLDLSASKFGTAPIQLANAVPIPGAILLFGTGLAALVAGRRRA